MSKYKIEIRNQKGESVATLHPHSTSKHATLYETKMMFLNLHVSSEYYATVEDSEGNVLHTVTCNESGMLTVTPEVTI